MPNPNELKHILSKIRAMLNLPVVAAGVIDTPQAVARAYKVNATLPQEVQDFRNQLINVLEQANGDTDLVTEIAELVNRALSKKIETYTYDPLVDATSPPSPNTKTELLFAQDIYALIEEVLDNPVIAHDQEITRAEEKFRNYMDSIQQTASATDIFVDFNRELFEKHMALLLDRATTAIHKINNDPSNLALINAAINASFMAKSVFTTYEYHAQAQIMALISEGQQATAQQLTETYANYGQRCDAIDIKTMLNSYHNLFIQNIAPFLNLPKTATQQNITNAEQELRNYINSYQKVFMQGVSDYFSKAEERMISASHLTAKEQDDINKEINQGFLSLCYTENLQKVQQNLQQSGLNIANYTGLYLGDLVKLKKDASKHRETIFEQLIGRINIIDYFFNTVQAQGQNINYDTTQVAQDLTQLKIMLFLVPPQKTEKLPADIQELENKNSLIGMFRDNPNQSKYNFSKKIFLEKLAGSLKISLQANASSDEIVLNIYADPQGKKHLLAILDGSESIPISAPSQTLIPISLKPTLPFDVILLKDYFEKNNNLNTQIFLYNLACESMLDDNITSAYNTLLPNATLQELLTKIYATPTGRQKLIELLIAIKKGENVAAIDVNDPRINDYLDATTLKIIATLLNVELDSRKTTTPDLLTDLLNKFHAKPKPHEATSFQRKLYQTVVALLRDRDRGSVARYIESLETLYPNNAITEDENRNLGALIAHTKAADIKPFIDYFQTNDNLNTRIFLYDLACDTMLDDGTTSVYNTLGPNATMPELVTKIYATDAGWGKLTNQLNRTTGNVTVAAVNVNDPRINAYLNKTILEKIATLLGVKLDFRKPTHPDLLTDLLNKFHAKPHEATTSQRKLYHAIIELLRNPGKANQYIQELDTLYTMSGKPDIKDLINDANAIFLSNHFEANDNLNTRIFLYDLACESMLDNKTSAYNTLGPNATISELVTKIYATDAGWKKLSALLNDIATGNSAAIGAVNINDPQIADYLNETNLKIIANLLDVKFDAGQITIEKLLEKFHAKPHDATTFQRMLYQAVVALLRNPGNAVQYIQKLKALYDYDIHRQDNILTSIAISNASDVKYTDNATLKYADRNFIVGALVDNAKAVAARNTNPAKQKDVTTTKTTLEEINTTGMVKFWNNPIKFFQQSTARILSYIGSFFTVTKPATTVTAAPVQASPLETAAHYPEIYEKVDLNRAMRETLSLRAKKALAIADRPNVEFATLNSAITELEKVIDNLKYINADYLSLQNYVLTDPTATAYCQTEIGNNPTIQKQYELWETRLPALRQKAFGLEITEAQNHMAKLLSAHSTNSRFKNDAFIYVQNLYPRLLRQIPDVMLNANDTDKTTKILTTLAQAITLLQTAALPSKTLEETITKIISETMVNKLKTRLEALEGNIVALRTKTGTNTQIYRDNILALHNEYLALHDGFSNLGVLSNQYTTFAAADTVAYLARLNTANASLDGLAATNGISLSRIASAAASTSVSSLSTSPMLLMQPHSTAATAAAATTATTTQQPVPPVGGSNRFGND